MTNPHSDFQQIIKELIQLQTGNPAYSLLQFQSLIGAQQYSRLYNLILEIVPHGSRILDWGAGNGHFSYFLLRSGYQVSAYSLEDHLLPERLKKQYPEFKYVRGKENEPVKLPFPDKSFQAVTSVGVLEHVREMGGEEKASLQEIRRVLKPGGAFICYHFPNRYSLIEAVSKFFPSKHHHQFKYDKTDIAQLGSQSGFEILKLERYGFLPRNMWGRFPQMIRNSEIVSRSWNTLDYVLSGLFNPFCQNHLFVARKSGS